ncbi:hypothetical protein [Tenacibaculum sp. C7A-26P2]|uniref:hypothetical protein n=1 Tax=Tenacibaculum sp. C7A-26P2 TaxID=3447504 RepID=UPI003F8419B6
MEERKINFRINDDPTLVVDKDGNLANKLEKLYGYIHLNLASCFEQLKEGKLTEGMKETHLSLTESYTIDFLKEANYDSILAKEKEKRLSEIRSLNDENRELRKKLGEKVSNEDAREKMKNLSESVKKWWNIFGFGHTSKIGYGQNGHMEIVFSGMISEGYYAKPDRITKERKLKYLIDLGFSFNEDECVIISDENINRLIRLINSKYPSAMMKELTCDFYSKHKTLRDIKVSITNLEDISN